MKKKVALPMFVIICGIIAGIIRVINLQNGYEPITNLSVDSDMSVIVLSLFSTVFVAIMFMISRKVRSVKGIDFAVAFRCVETRYKTKSVCIGALMLASGAFGLYTTLIGRENYNVFSQYEKIRVIPSYVMFILLILAGVSIVVVTSAQSKIEVDKKLAGFILIPMFWACFELIVTYIDNSAVPTISLYAFEIFASIAIMYTFYVMAAFVFSKPKAKNFVFWSSCAGFFSIMTVIGNLYDRFLGKNVLALTNIDIVKTIVLLSASMFIISNLFILLSNLQYQVSIADKEEME